MRAPIRVELQDCSYREYERTCITDNEPFDVLRVDVVHQLGLEVLLEFLVWNGREQGPLDDGRYVAGGLLALLQIVGNKDIRGILPVKSQELPAANLDS